MRRFSLLGAGFLLAAGVTPEAGARVYRVGPEAEYRRPSDVADKVSPGDVVEIMPGTYVNDDAVWRASRLTLRGVGGRPHLKIEKNYGIKNRKAIWVIAGDDVRIENIEFSGAHVPALNGAGLRVEGAGLTVKNCYFHHNEFGLLSGKTEGTLAVLSSQFAYQHRKGRFAHGIYVGDAERFVFQGNYVHHSDGGHHVKSRARSSLIRYNLLSDGDGQSSYAIDLPNCGDAVVLGNVMVQGEGSVNHGSVAFGAEGCMGKPASLAVVHNSFVNHFPGGGVFVRNHNGRSALIANNLILGRAEVVSGKAEKKRNRKLASCAGSDEEIIACLSAMPFYEGLPMAAALTPFYQYRHPAAYVVRPADGKIAVGALQPIR